MKTLLKTSFLFLMMFSLSSFAEKVMIAADPVMLEKKGEVYMLPTTYTVNKDNNYVTVEGKSRVCFLDKQPALSSLDMMAVTVDVAGTKTMWNCYEYNTDFFEMTPKA